jgi:hypothetical protein
MTEPLTPTENTIRNMDALMTWRSLSHQSVAEAMDVLGYSWYRKTVHRVLSGERPIRVDELYGLALVLDTTVGALLAPDITSDGDVKEFPGETYRIGAMPPIGAERFRKLLDVPDDKLARSDVGVHGWAPDYLVDGVPQWKAWPSASLIADLNDVLARSGWKHVDEFVAAHPEAQGVPWSEFFAYIEEHPNPRREVPLR